MIDKPDPAGKGEKGFEIEEDVTGIEIPSSLPVLTLRGLVIFPGQIHPFLVSRAASLKLIEDLPGPKSIIALTDSEKSRRREPATRGSVYAGHRRPHLKDAKVP